MKIIYFYILFILLLISAAVYSQSMVENHFYPGGYDSLLFDGAEEQSFGQLSDDINDCYVNVIYVKGTANGTRHYKYIEKGCGVADTVSGWKNGKVKEKDKLRASETISTGPDGWMEIKLSDGKFIRFSPNTTLTINSEYCRDIVPVQIDLLDGQIFVDDTHGNKSKPLDIRTTYGTAIMEGTKFTYEIQKNGDITTEILKVYDGSVKFNKNIQNGKSMDKTAAKGEEMKKLYDDYKAGKITNEEFGKKMTELQSGIQETLPVDPVSVTAGFQSKVVGTDNPTPAESFDTGANRWFDDTNFN